MEALLIHWHISLKFNSENRNTQTPEIGRKNRPFHPQINVLFINIGLQCSHNKKKINKQSQILLI